MYCISKFYFQKLFDSPLGHGQKIFSGRFALQGVSICANCQINVEKFALKVAFLKYFSGGSVISAG